MMKIFAFNFILLLIVIAGCTSSSSDQLTINGEGSGLQDEAMMDIEHKKNIEEMELQQSELLEGLLEEETATESLSEILVAELKKLGLDNCRMEGKDSSDWKLVDAYDVIVHIFHPEKREFYNLEKMWSEEIPKEKAMI